MNSQEVVNKVYHALTKQQAQSTNQSYCLYLAENGNKCAVGHLFPQVILDDKELMEELNRQSVPGIRSTIESSPHFSIPEVQEFVKLLRDEYDVLNQLQRIHDSVEHSVHWQQNFFDVQIDRMCNMMSLRHPKAR